MLRACCCAAASLRTVRAVCVAPASHAAARQLADMYLKTRNVSTSAARLDEAQREDVLRAVSDEEASCSLCLTGKFAADEDTLVRTSADKLPAAALALSTKKVWEVIRNQRDLNLPAHKVRCAVPHMSCRFVHHKQAHCTMQIRHLACRHQIAEYMLIEVGWS